METAKHINKELNMKFEFPDLKTAVIRFVESGRIDDDNWELYDDLDARIFGDDAMFLYNVVYNKGKEE